MTWMVTDASYTRWEALLRAAQAIRSQADIRFDDDGAKAIDTVLLGRLTTAVEAIEAKSEVE